MKRTAIVSIMLGLLLALPVQAQNLVGNSGLEDLSPAFWTPVNGTFGTEVDVTSDTAKYGFNSFTITKTATAAEVGWLSDNNANKYWNHAEAGTYAVSAWIKTTGVNTGPTTDAEKIGVVFTFNTAAGVELSTVTVWADQTNTSTSWTQVTDVAILSEAPGEVFVKMIMGKDATGTVNFDGIGCGTDPWSMGVFNSSAENGAGWLDWYAGKGNYTRVTSAEAHTGTYSVEMVQPDTMSTESELVYYSIPYPVEAGEWYRIGVWIKTVGVIDSADYEADYATKKNVNERVNLCYMFHDDLDIETGWTTVGDRFVYVDQTVADSGWTHYVVADKAPEGATGINIRARFNHFTTGAAYFDDFSVVKMVTPVVAIEERGGIAQYPSAYRLSQNYPNPFNPQTVIQYSCPEIGWVRLDVYNILGQKVTTLVDGNHSVGTYNVIWNSADDRGQRVASGVYIYTLRTNDTRIAKKMLLIR